MHEFFNKTITIKQLISYLFGFPAAILTTGQVEDLNYWWVPFVAWLALILIIFWNAKDASEPRHADTRTNYDWRLRGRN